jgi:hypothetical protein
MALLHYGHGQLQYSRSLSCLATTSASVLVPCQSGRLYVLIIFFIDVHQQY